MKTIILLSIILSFSLANAEEIKVEKPKEKNIYEFEMTEDMNFKWKKNKLKGIYELNERLNLQMDFEARDIDRTKSEFMFTITF